MSITQNSLIYTPKVDKWRKLPDITEVHTALRTHAEAAYKKYGIPVLDGKAMLFVCKNAAETTPSKGNGYERRPLGDIVVAFNAPITGSENWTKFNGADNTYDSTTNRGMHGLTALNHTGLSASNIRFGVDPSGMVVVGIWMDKVYPTIAMYGITASLDYRDKLFTRFTNLGAVYYDFNEWPLYDDYGYAQAIAPNTKNAPEYGHEWYRAPAGKDTSAYGPVENLVGVGATLGNFRYWEPGTPMTVDKIAEREVIKSGCVSAGDWIAGPSPNPSYGKYALWHAPTGALIKFSNTKYIVAIAARRLEQRLPYIGDRMLTEAEIDLASNCGSVWDAGPGETVTTTGYKRADGSVDLGSGDWETAKDFSIPDRLYEYITDRVSKQLEDAGLVEGDPTYKAVQKMYVDMRTSKRMESIAHVRALLSELISEDGPIQSRIREAKALLAPYGYNFGDSGSVMAFGRMQLQTAFFFLRKIGKLVCVGYLDTWDRSYYAHNNKKVSHLWVEESEWRPEKIDTSGRHEWKSAKIAVERLRGSVTVGRPFNTMANLSQIIMAAVKEADPTGFQGVTKEVMFAARDSAVPGKLAQDEAGTTALSWVIEYLQSVGALRDAGSEGWNNVKKYAAIHGWSDPDGVMAKTPPKGSDIAALVMSLTRPDADTVMMWLATAYASFTVTTPQVSNKPAKQEEVEVAEEEQSDEDRIYYYLAEVLDADDEDLDALPVGDINIPGLNPKKIVSIAKTSEWLTLTSRKLRSGKTVQLVGLSEAGRAEAFGE